MEQHDLFYQYNPWWEQRYQPESYIPRPIFEHQLSQRINDKSVVMLTGLRRVGKTTLLKKTVHDLLEQEIDSQHIFYISLDDYQLNQLSILEIIDEYRKLHRLARDVKIFVFLDEITYKENFQQQLKNLYDHGNIKLFVSSSSSSALRDQRGFLTGRQSIVEINPLNFEEYLRFKNIVVKERDSSLLEKYFEDYLQIGGMPEYVLNNDRGYLTELVNDILHKDIIGFHGIRQPQVIKDYFALLMERAGKQISLNKVARILGISVDSAKRYLDMFSETFLIYLVPRYGKTNETILSQKKVYAADLGIRNLFTGFRDKGAAFENHVFSLIKSFNPRYLYQAGVELDFVTEKKVLIEVKYGNQKMNEKQKALFDTFEMDEKICVNGFRDLSKLTRLLSLD